MNRISSLSPEAAWIACAGLLALVLGWVAWAYNRLVKARNQMREGWSGIEVQLKRRHDLIPMLLEVVKGYQTHERELLESVTRERSAALEARGASQAGSAESMLGQGLGRIVALAERYPELKADGAFRGLMVDLVEIEDQIQFARRYYNGSVRDLNNRIESFPGNLVAAVFAFQKEEFFEIENASERMSPDLARALRG